MAGFLFLFLLKAFSCSQFCVDHFVAKSFDWHDPQGQIFVNLKNQKKEGSLLKSLGIPHQKWHSKYGSLSFSILGKDRPLGGMNERGLVVEVSNLPLSQFPTYSHEARFDDLEITQYLLDRFETIDEVIKNFSTLKIQNVLGKLQYFICDAKSKCMVIYAEKGALKYTRLFYRVLTNEPYPISFKKYLANTPSTPRGLPTPYHRFRRLVDTLHETKIKDYSDVLKVMENARTAVPKTQWQIVYDTQNKIVYWKVDEKIKNLHMKGISFECKKEVIGYSLEGKPESNVLLSQIHLATPYFDKKYREEIVWFFKNQTFLNDCNP